MPTSAPPPRRTTKGGRPPRTFAAAITTSLLGLTTCILVAWTCSTTASHRPPSTRTVGLLEPDEVSCFGPPLPRTTLRVSTWPGCQMVCWHTGADALPPPKSAAQPDVPAWSALAEASADTRRMVVLGQVPMIVDWRAGWPWPALHGRLPSADLVSAATLSTAGGVIHLRDTKPRIATGTTLFLSGHLFPYRPHWPGLAAGSALYTAAWLTALALASSARALANARARRGRCPRCAYDLSATPTGLPCPECGKPTRRHKPHGTETMNP